MAIKVTKNEVDVETEIMQRLNEYGLEIDFDDDSEENDKDSNKTNEKEEEEE